MTFRVMLKDPDGPYEGIRDAAKASLADLGALSEDEREDLMESRIESLSDFAKRWLQWGEYAHIEFDTEAGTATLLPAK